MSDKKMNELAMFVALDKGSAVLVSDLCSVLNCSPQVLNNYASDLKRVWYGSQLYIKKIENNVSEYRIDEDFFESNSGENLNSRAAEDRLNLSIRILRSSVEDNNIVLGDETVKQNPEDGRYYDRFGICYDEDSIYYDEDECVLKGDGIIWDWHNVFDPRCAMVPREKLKHEAEIILPRSYKEEKVNDIIDDILCACELGQELAKRYKNYILHVNK